MTVSGTVYVTIGLNMCCDCEFLCCCCCGLEKFSGGGGSGLLGAGGGSGTTIIRCGIGGLEGGPGSGISSLSLLRPLLHLKKTKYVADNYVGFFYLGGGSTFWLRVLPSWICWKFLRKVSPPGAWTMLLGSPAIWGSSSSFSDPEYLQK